MLFDPILRSKTHIAKYTYGFEKKKPIDIVRWLEKGPNRPISSRFMVVYNDGMIGFYHKDREVPSTLETKDKQGNTSTAPYDPEKDICRLGEEKVSKQQIMKRMRGFVEDYSFDEYFMLDLGGTISRKKGESNIPDASGMIRNKVQTELSAIKLRENIHVRRQLNFIAALFESHGSPPIEINPYYLMRFDCPQVNDILTFWPH